MYVPYAGETTHILSANQEIMQAFVKWVSISVRKIRMRQISFLRGLPGLRKLTYPS